MMLTIIFSTLPFFVALCWMVVFIIDYKRHNREKKIFAYLLGTCAALYLTHATYYLGDRETFGLLESLYAYCHLAVFPLSFLYIKALTDPRPLRPRNFAMLTIPAVIFIWSIACYACMGNDRQIFVNHVFFGEKQEPCRTAATVLQTARLHLAQVIFVLQIILVIIYGSKNLNRFKKQVSDFYSNVDGRDLRSVRLFIKIMWGYSIAAFIANIAGREFFAGTRGLLAATSLVFSSLLFGMCYAVRREHFSADRFAEEESDAVPEEPGLDASASVRDTAAPAADASNPESELLASTSDHYIWIGPALDALMSSQEVFRDNDLLITDVAKMIGSNRTYVSTYLNKEKGLSFSDYVNGYRVDYAKRLLDCDANLNLVEIAERSGFSGEASFYRVFKRFTGKTPNEYRRGRA